MKLRHASAGRAARTLALFLFAGATAYAQQQQTGGLDISGSLLGDASVLQTAFESPTGISPGGFSQLTLNFVNRNRQFAKVEGSGILTVWTGAYAPLAASQASVSGLFAAVTPEGSAAVTGEVRKLYLEVFTPLADISAGRQIINFGVGTLFSPIDAFTVPLLSDLNYVRTGSDVVRVDAQFNDVSGLEAVSTVGSSFSTLSSALKLYTNVFDFDLAGVGLYRGSRNDLIAGAYFKGDVEIGIYGEAVQHFVTSPWQMYFEGMLGADYSISQTYFFTLEYYYNGNPAAPGSLGPLDLANAPALFLNQHYLYFMTRWQPTELIGVSASIIWDISASVVLPTLQFTYNVVQNANLVVYGRYFSGDIRSGASWTGPDFQYGVEVQVSF
ncbi:MAG TPA: hypothetical protein VL354_05700 [Spirochaetia bacterium]|nr:hypothetical protein [Spirochaetia bacterium]